MFATPPHSRSQTPAASHSPHLSQRPRVESLPRNSYSTSWVHQTQVQPSARRTPAAHGGSELAGPRCARCPPARMHTLGPGTGKAGADPARSQNCHAPAREPPPHRVHPASVRGPWTVRADALCPLTGGTAAPNDPC